MNSPGDDRCHQSAVYNPQYSQHDVRYHYPHDGTKSRYLLVYIPYGNAVAMQLGVSIYKIMSQICTLYEPLCYPPGISCEDAVNVAVLSS